MLSRHSHSKRAPSTGVGQSLFDDPTGELKIIVTCNVPIAVPIAVTIRMYCGLFVLYMFRFEPIGKN